MGTVLYTLFFNLKNKLGPLIVGIFGSRSSDIAIATGLLSVVAFIVFVIPTIVGIIYNKSVVVAFFSWLGGLVMVAFLFGLPLSNLPFSVFSVSFQDLWFDIIFKIVELSGIFFGVFIGRRIKWLRMNGDNK